MKRIYKTKEKRKLVPGTYYPFWVIKTVYLPDHAAYFILQDPYGDKHLLPSTYYRNYPIQVKSYYLCHVDKINCSGRIFLEPVHPFYKIGEIYEFYYQKEVMLYSKKNPPQKYFQMLGETGEWAYLPAQFKNIKHTASSIPCLIQYIKKAQIFLDLSSKGF